MLGLAGKQRWFRDRYQGRWQMTEYHADDYGISLRQCDRIINCHINGLLNGISIMPNSDILEEAMEKIAPYEDKIAYTVHLNLKEGHCNADPALIPHLTDSKGIYNVFFGKYVISSYLPFRRNVMRKELAIELKAQIDRIAPYFKDGEIRLDGHGHYHMIPVVFDALCDVIRENDLNVTFIRVPREDVPLYLRHRKEIKDFKAVNFVKVAVLNYFAGRNLRKHADIFKRAKPYDFMGVMLSGHMSYDNVYPVYKDAIDRAKAKGNDIEILFHPGSVHEEEACAKLTDPGDIWFLVDEWREKEADALLRLEEYEP